MPATPPSGSPDPREDRGAGANVILNYQSPASRRVPRVPMITRVGIGMVVYVAAVVTSMLPMAILTDGFFGRPENWWVVGLFIGPPVLVPLFLWAILRRLPGTVRGMVAGVLVALAIASVVFWILWF